VIDHFNLPVIDLDRSELFYTRTLKELGLRVLARDGNAIGFGVDTWQFGLILSEPSIPKLHLAFKADGREAVDAFYRAGLKAGAASNGAPGLRPQYHPDYYAAFLRDPDGHNIEAVYRGAGGA
jgi:catechol 2,3-dioxygenase-like lactoylglutathione lyase family enzyme